MNDGAAEPDDLHQRLQRLEAEHRRLRGLMVLSLAGLAIAMTVLAWLVVARDGARFRTVEAERFVVRDSLNQRRAELGMYSNVVRLTLGGDERSARGIVMGVGPSVRPQMTLKSGDDGPALMLMAESVGLEHRHGEPGALFYLHRELPWLSMWDTRGHRVYNDSLRLRR